MYVFMDIKAVSPSIRSPFVKSPAYQLPGATAAIRDKPELPGSKLLCQLNFSTLPCPRANCSALLSVSKGEPQRTFG